MGRWRAYRALETSKSFFPWLGAGKHPRNSISGPYADPRPLQLECKLPRFYNFGTLIGKSWILLAVYSMQIAKSRISR